MLWFGDDYSWSEVAGSTDPAGRRGPVRSAEAEQGVKRRHGLAPAIVTKDELVEVDGQLGTADAMVGTNQPLLEVANGPVGERHHRGDASVQVTAEGLRPGDMPKRRRLQAGERLQPVGIESRARGDVLLEKTGDGGRLEVANHAHADTSCPAAPLLDCHQHECGPPAFELAASAQPRLRTANPSVVNLDRTVQRLAGRIHHGAAQFVEHQPRRFITAEPKLALQSHRRNTPRVGRHQIRRPEPLGQWQLGLVEDSPRGQRDLMPATRALPPVPVDKHIRVPAPTALTHESVRPTARRQILLAGVFGGELALKLAETLGKGWAGHRLHYI